MSTKCNLVPAIVVLSLATAGCHPASSPAGDLLEIPAQLGPDGALRFASVDDFFDAADAIRNKSPAQLDRWERGLGFLSMRRAFAELEERLGAATGDQRTALLDANADLLAPGSTVDELARRIPATAYAAFVDRRGVLYVADVAHKVTWDRAGRGARWPRRRIQLRRQQRHARLQRPDERHHDGR
jgi:hypothetical protein